MSDQLQILTVTVSSQLSPKSLEKLKQNFKTVHRFTDPESVTEEVMRETEVWFTGGGGLAGKIKGVGELGGTRVVQLASAGVNNALKHPALSSEEGRKQIKVCSASGIHSMSIPQWCIAQIINIYTNIPAWHHQLATEKKWPSSETRKALTPNLRGRGNASLYGKTAGLLGYGHIAREVARQLKTFNVDVIAANSAGKAREDDGYIIKGTGDKDGSLPSQYYSTTDEESFKAFLKRCDILIASLPSTPQTQWLLKPEHLALLPDGSVFLNVGRGDLVHTDDLIKALDSQGGLYAIALDVTDPEPLGDDSPLWGHSRAFITPHTSGDFVGYLDEAVELLVRNVGRMRRGEGGINVVDWGKGY